MCVETVSGRLQYRQDTTTDIKLQYYHLLDSSTVTLFGVQTLWTQNTSDPRHFGPTKVRTQDTLARPKCPGTSALVSKCQHTVPTLKSNHTAHYAKAYLWIADNNFKFNSIGLYRAALSLSGELQSLVLTMSSCSAPCSTASERAKIIRRAWLQTTNQLENEGRQSINVSASNTRETEWRSDVNIYGNSYSIWTE